MVFYPSPLTLFQLYAKLKEEKDFGRAFKSAVSKKSGINNYGGLGTNSAEGWLLGVIGGRV